MDYACAIRHGDVIIAVNYEALLMLFCHRISRALVKRFVFSVLKILAFICLKNLICLLSVL